jgi:CMP-N,N'-diacetyllegionaminic acid synthase
MLVFRGSMIGRKSVIGVVPARGGSKGVYRKNLRAIAGKPLIAWSIEAAQKACLIDRLVVDTDDAEIASVVRSYGAEVPFMRPSALATDTASVIDALIHLLDRLDDAFDYVVLLQCTSPLRTTEDIDTAIELCVRSGAPACVSITMMVKPPQWMLRLDDNGRISPLLGWDGFHRRRQDLEVAYLPNGAVFMASVPWFRKQRSFFTAETIAYVMPPERAYDVDTELDLLDVERQIERVRAPGV